MVYSVVFHSIDCKNSTQLHAFQLQSGSKRSIIYLNNTCFSRVIEILMFLLTCSRKIPANNLEMVLVCHPLGEDRRVIFHPTLVSANGNLASVADRHTWSKKIALIHMQYSPSVAQRTCWAWITACSMRV